MKHSPAVLVISLSCRLLDSWTDDTFWTLLIGSWTLAPPPTVGLFTRRHKEPRLLLFLFFLTHFMACVVAAADGLSFVLGR